MKKAPWSPWKRIPRLLKKAVPRSFLGRAFLIILTPVVMIQLLSAYVFFDRHWDYITRMLAKDIAREVRVIKQLLDETSAPQGIQHIQQTTAPNLGFHLIQVSQPWKTIPEKRTAFQSFLKQALRDNLEQTPFKLSLNEHWIRIWLQTTKGTFLAQIPLKRLFSRTTPLFLMWSVGSSIFFVILALLFMKNQIRPLKRLARHADQLGRGKTQEKFKSQGAAEIRKLAWTLHMMSLRLQKQVQERSQMLAEISHDLRTPLTRMKLQLALMKPSPDLEDLRKDVDHMVHLVESFLDFSKEHQPEPPQRVHLYSFLTDLLQQLDPGDKHITLEVPKSLRFSAQQHGLTRCLTNILENAIRYANKDILITAKKTKAWTHLFVQDDGPGIPKSHHQDVFRPFFRVDVSRNDETGGLGLGLNIVQNIMNVHAGSIHLEDVTPHGLRVELRFPNT